MTSPDVPAPLGESDEAGSLAIDLARAYKQLTALYHHQLELTVPEADRRARGLDYTPEEAAADLARMVERPPSEVSWFDLNRLLERDPEAVARLWRTIRTEARKELESGHRTAHALEWRGGPWSRARFLAIRASFRDGTPPRDGIESALMDTAAEAFGDVLEWQEHLHMQVSTEIQSERRRVERDGDWSPMRLSYAESIEQSARMAERAHKRFLQTVKLLHDLQRSTPAVYVGTAAQVNVGQQQVNVASSTRGRTRPADLPKSSGRTRKRQRIVPIRDAVRGD